MCAAFEMMQLQNTDFQNAMTIQSAIQSDAQKQQMERWRVLLAIQQDIRKFELDLKDRFVGLGDFLMDSRDTANARKAYEAALMILEDNDTQFVPEAAKGKRPIAISTKQLANVSIEQRLASIDHQEGKYDDAFRRLSGLSEIVHWAAAEKTLEPQTTAKFFGDLAFHALFVSAFAEALKLADQACAHVPSPMWVKTKVHALMFLQNVDEARKLYLTYRGVKSWEKTVLDDFVELQKAGLHNSLMAEIEQAFVHPI